VEPSLLGKRVGVTWLASACGNCAFCKRGEENLCARAEFTGCHRDGGFAEQCTARAEWVIPLPEGWNAEETAPLLCAGVIGYRAYRMALRSTAEVDRVGLYGFGSAAHLLAQIARADGRRVFALTRPRDRVAQELALSLGATWAGDTDPPEPLDAALLFAPAGELVPRALGHLRKGGAVICAGIHMSDIPSFPYELLWGERTVRSVANVTREDAYALFERLKSVSLQLALHSYPLEAAEQALADLREGRFSGSAVLVVKKASEC
jgi:propanol-preferring alcohol dehydrogenase